MVFHIAFKEPSLSFFSAFSSITISVLAPLPPSTFHSALCYGTDILLEDISRITVTRAMVLTPLILSLLASNERSKRKGAMKALQGRKDFIE
jgi:hypothetical protein